MTPALRGKVDTEKEKLAALLEKGSVVVSNARSYTDQLGGRIAWGAAKKLIEERRAFIVETARRRITKGPRPHNRTRLEMTIKKPAADEI